MFQKFAFLARVLFLCSTDKKIKEIHTIFLYVNQYVWYGMVWYVWFPGKKKELCFYFLRKLFTKTLPLTLKYTIGDEINSDFIKNDK